MRTIILTSAGFGTSALQRDLLRILPKEPSKLKVAYVTTAAKVEESKDFVERDRKVLLDLGFPLEEVDVEGQSRATLAKLLGGRDIIFVQGGNTFYLLKQVRKSGFDKVVKDLIGRGIAYIGVSAGSYIACPTIEMTTWKKHDRNRYGVRDFSAMNLVPFLLSVHYNREKYREGVKEGIAKAKYPVRILTDDQALLIRDDRVTLLGGGEEIKL